MVVNLVNARESYNWSYYVPRKLNTLRLAVTFHCVFFFDFLSAITFIKDPLPIYGVCNTIDKGV